MPNGYSKNAPLSSCRNTEAESLDQTTEVKHFGITRSHLELLAVLVRSRLQSEVAKNYLNFLWWVFEPMLTLMVFYLVFGILLQRGTDGYVDFLLVGVVVWSWVQKSVSNGNQSLMIGKGLMLQVYFPKILLPLATVLQDLIKQVFVFALLLVYLITAGYFSISWLALPLVFVLQLAFVAGVTGVVAALVPFVPDLRFVVNTLLQLLMFGSGVFYGLDMIPEIHHDLFLANPVAALINMYRDVLLFGKMPAIDSIVNLSAFSAVFIISAYALLQRFDRRYPRVLAQ